MESKHKHRIQTYLTEMNTYIVKNHLHSEASSLKCKSHFVESGSISFDFIMPMNIAPDPMDFILGEQ